jgi:hypothetical protein
LAPVRRESELAWFRIAEEDASAVGAISSGGGS